MLLRLARWQVALKAAEGSTSSDVLENGCGVSTANLIQFNSQRRSELRHSVIESPLPRPRRSSKFKVGPREILDGDSLTDSRQGPS